MKKHYNQYNRTFLENLNFSNGRLPNRKLKMGLIVYATNNTKNPNSRRLSIKRLNFRRLAYWFTMKKLNGTNAI